MTHPDFDEGKRAVIIDKDNAPLRSLATLDAGTDDFVAEAFANLGDVELVLPSNEAAPASKECHKIGFAQ